MWDGERFRFGIEWRERLAQNPRLPAVPYPPFAKCAKDGAPTLWLCQRIRKPGPPARTLTLSKPVKNNWR